MVRRENDMPPDIIEPAGVGLRRNPGVTAIYVVRSFRLFRDGAGRSLIEMPEEHESIEWWAEGRTATREEIQHSIDTGVPSLMELAQQEGPEAVAALNASIKRLEGWL